jgi:hypothetical protein
MNRFSSYYQSQLYPKIKLNCGLNQLLSRYEAHPKFDTYHSAALEIFTGLGMVGGAAVASKTGSIVDTCAGATGGFFVGGLFGFCSPVLVPVMMGGVAVGVPVYYVRKYL